MSYLPTNKKVGCRLYLIKSLFNIRIQELTLPLSEESMIKYLHKNVTEYFYSNQSIQIRISKSINGNINLSCPLLFQGKANIEILFQENIKRKANFKIYWSLRKYSFQPAAYLNHWTMSIFVFRIMILCHCKFCNEMI